MDIQEILETRGDLFAGRYTLKNKLGRGGMGTVYLVQDTLLQELVALKVLHLKFVEDKQSCRKFLREVKVAREITHPCVVRTFDAGKHNGLLFFTMELVNGQDLKNLYLYNRPSVDEIVGIIYETCIGLHAIHEAGVLHRDLKPANIIISSDGELKITDFGIATRKLSTYGHARGDGYGSAGFMPPEVFMEKETGLYTDIYSLGGVAYFLMCGDSPFTGTSVQEVLNKQLCGQFKSPSEVRSDIPEWLEELVTRMLSKDPGGRPESAEEIVRIIESSYEDPEAQAETSSHSDPEDPQRYVDGLTDTDARPLIDQAVENAPDSPAIITLSVKAERQSSIDEALNAQTSVTSLVPGGLKGVGLRATLGVFVSAVWIWLISTFWGESIIAAWSQVTTAEQPVAQLLGAALPPVLYCLSAAIPVILMALMLRGRRALVSATLAGLLISSSLFLINFGLLGWKASGGIWESPREDRVKNVQWVAEATIQRLVESALLMPRGTVFDPPAVDAVGSWTPEWYDPIIHHEEALNLSALKAQQGFGRSHTSLVLIENYGAPLLAHLPFLLLSVCYALALITFSSHAGITGRWLPVFIVAISLTGFMAGEFYLEDIAVEYGPAFLGDSVEFQVGPFFHISYGYALLCSLFNWTFVAVSAFLAAGFTRKKLSLKSAG